LTHFLYDKIIFLKDRISIVGFLGFILNKQLDEAIVKMPYPKSSI